MKLPVKKDIKPCKLSFASLFWLFLIGSVIGFVLEGIWHVMRTGEWEDHVSTVWGPFCTVYGVGATMIYAVSYLLQNKNIAVQFFVYGGIGTAVEYFTSLFQELLFGSTSWNYDDHIFNIGGRVSLQMTLLWGLLGISFVRLVFPYLSLLLGKLNKRSWNIVCAFCSAVMAINLLVSASAVMRWGERMEQEEADNEWEEFLDVRFHDERMRETYPNMVFQSLEASDTEA